MPSPGFKSMCGLLHTNVTWAQAGMANENAALLLMKQLKGARAVPGTRPPLSPHLHARSPAAAPQT